MKTILQYGAGAMLLAALTVAPASAQRAVTPPSATLTGSSTPLTAPPPGMNESNFVWGGEVETHLQGEVTVPDRSAAQSTVFDDSAVSLYGNYSTWLSGYSQINLERTRQDNSADYYPDRNSFMRSEALTMRQLFATARPSNDLALYAGKIHPAFGSAYELAPGNFYNFASDYEQDERIGAGAAYRVPDPVGQTNLLLSGEAFFLDTSPLSNTLLSRPSPNDPTANRPRRYALGQFGAANTNRPDSFTVALRGGQAERGLTYQVSVTREATIAPGGKAEVGESVGASYDPTGDGIPIAERIGVTPFLEYTHFNNFGGSAGLDANYAIAGLSFTRGRWQLALAGGLRHDSQAGTATLDHQENVSLNYAINAYVTAGGGVNYINLSGQGGSWTFGPSLSIAFGF
jgi:hypothetical protein